MTWISIDDALRMQLKEDSFLYHFGKTTLWSFWFGTLFASLGLYISLSLQISLPSWLFSLLWIFPLVALCVAVSLGVTCYVATTDKRRSLKILSRVMLDLEPSYSRFNLFPAIVVRVKEHLSHMAEKIVQLENQGFGQEARRARKIFSELFDAAKNLNILDKDAVFDSFFKKAEQSFSGKKERE